MTEILIPLFFPGSKFFKHVVYYATNIQKSFIILPTSFPFRVAMGLSCFALVPSITLLLTTSWLLQVTGLSPLISFHILASVNHGFARSGSMAI